MTDPYLIAHLVRGEPAFDIASQLPCPECHSIGCPECDELGYWWVVPTSGHRAYPYKSWNLTELELSGYPITMVADLLKPAPLGTPDHYPHSATPTTPKGALAAALALAFAPPSAPIKRRV